MKTYYCPYCGEKVLTASQKRFSPRVEVFKADKYANSLWFTCKHCHNQVGHKLSDKADKYIKIFFVAFLLIYILSYLISPVITGVFVLISLFVIITAVCVAYCVINEKFSLFVRREGEYNDVLLDAKVNFFDKYDFCNEAIYCLKPSKEYTQLTNIKREYIIAITQCNKENNTCKLRMIKPEFTQIKEDVIFEIYHEDKHIGTAQIK